MSPLSRFWRIQAVCSAFLLLRSLCSVRFGAVLVMHSAGLWERDDLRCSSTFSSGLSVLVALSCCDECDVCVRDSGGTGITVIIFVTIKRIKHVENSITLHC
jgi:hypothetical protein